MVVVTGIFYPSKSVYLWLHFFFYLTRKKLYFRGSYIGFNVRLYVENIFNILAMIYSGPSSSGIVIKIYPFPDDDGWYTSFLSSLM